MKLFVALTIAATALAQNAAPPAPVRSPEVGADRTVTFRLRAPNAREVLVSIEGQTQRVALAKDEKGVWSGTSAALEPDLYGYSFLADGVALIDPGNPAMKPNLLNTQSVVHVPGNGLVWEVADVPHGTLHRHPYKSAVVGDQREYFVYTPAGYDPAARKTYPVLYLLHGFSDDASGWSAVGKAHVILDNLIAQGKAEPMLVVMPLGYGAPEIVRAGFGGFRDPGLRQRNFDRFREALLTEVLPAVEKSYRVNKDREQRAIAGLSMGGAETLYTGLNNIDKFAYVAAFSAGGNTEDYAAAYPNLTAKQANAGLKMLWIGCGTEDRLMESNRKFRQWLKSKEINVTEVETPGGHTWLVWRRYLAEIAPALFKKKVS
ncbi:MAG: esterase [Acidobacteria bacterium]|nr:esterase [Acidobacteriota bacterium]